MTIKAPLAYRIAVNQLENSVAVLLRDLRDYEAKAPLTPPFKNLAERLQSTLDHYRASKRELNKVRP